MKNLFASILSVFSVGLADMGSNACMVLVIDEPEMPESLIK
mgnify:FL=1